MKKLPLFFGLVLIVGLVSVYFLTFNKTITTGQPNAPITNSTKTADSEQHCGGEALTKDSPIGATPKVECYTNEEAAIEGALGTAWISTNQEGIKDSFSKQFPSIKPLTFVDAQKQVCAAMIVDIKSKIVKAQCFDSQQEAENAAKTWSSIITSANNK